jgi:tRNA threonylcarbamoyladenosine biosynthesis protein TsaB
MKTVSGAVSLAQEPPCLGFFRGKSKGESGLILLAIDTCGASGAVALGRFLRTHDPMSQAGDREHTRVWSRELAGKTYSELLLSTIDDLLRDAEVTPNQLSGIVVVRGPGSFTGIRIGVSAAKGLAEGLAIPVISLSRLELLARKAQNRSAAAVLDAGRGEFYAGFYRDGICETEALLTHAALLEAVAASGLPALVCEEQAFSTLGDLNPELVGAPWAADALCAGVERFRAALFDEVSTLDANYLRRSESEMLARIAEHAAQRVPAATSATVE